VFELSPAESAAWRQGPNLPHARWLSRNKDSSPPRLFTGIDKKLARIRCIEGLRETKAGRRSCRRLVNSPQSGAAEALYGIGANADASAAARISHWSICSSRCTSPPTIRLALLSLADLYESWKKPAMAIKFTSALPANSP